MTIEVSVAPEDLQIGDDVEVTLFVNGFRVGCVAGNVTSHNSTGIIIQDALNPRTFKRSYVLLQGTSESMNQTNVGITTVIVRMKEE